MKAAPFMGKRSPLEAGMARNGKNRVKGELDITGTQARVASPGRFEGGPTEKAPEPMTYMDIERGPGQKGLRRLGKKILHLKTKLRERYDRTKPV